MPGIRSTWPLVKTQSNPALSGYVDKIADRCAAADAARLGSPADARSTDAREPDV